MATKINRTREDLVHLEDKKIRLDKDVEKVDHSIASRRGLLKDLEAGILRLQEESSEYSATS
jgi:hypothetical protein